MSYPREQLLILQKHDVDLNVAAVKSEMVVPQKCSLERVSIGVQDAPAGGGTVTFTGSVAGLIGTIILPAADNSGKAFFDVDARGTELAAGESISIETTVDGGLMSTVNSLFVIAQYSPETEENQSNLVETA